MSAWDTNPELVEQLKTMVAEGAPFSRIARWLGHGLTRNACIGKARRMGLVKLGNPEEAAIKKARVARAKPDPISQPIDPVIEAPATPGIRMLDLQYGHCRFPLWAHRETGAPEFLHCGEPKKIGSYCEKHARIAFGQTNIRAFRKDAASKLADVARNAKGMEAAQ